MDHAPWLITALEAMLFNSMKASWFRMRQDDLFTALQNVEIPEKRWGQTVIDYDLSNKTEDALTLSTALGMSTSPMVELANDMGRDELGVLVKQVERLYNEEMEERDVLDEYIMNVMDVLKELLQAKSNVTEAVD